METKFTDVSGLRVRYLETNGRNDIPLIILHGWASCAARWEKILSHLEGKNIRAIALDLPGRGETPAPNVAWDLDDYVKFAIDFIAALRIEKFYLLGYSFGGRIAIKIGAGGYCGLEKLILVSAAGVTPRDKKRIFLYKISTKIGGLIFSLPLLCVFRNIARKFTYFFSGGYDFYVLEGPMRETFKNIIHEDLTSYLASIRVQTLIIWGQNDRMTPLSDARLMHNRINGSTLVVIKGGSHSVNIDRAEEVAEEMLKFTQ